MMNLAMIIPPPTAYGAEYSYNKQWGQQDRLRSAIVFKCKYRNLTLNKFGEKSYHECISLNDIEKPWWSSSVEFCASSLIRLIFCGFFNIRDTESRISMGITAVLPMISCKNGNGATSRAGGVGNSTGEWGGDRANAGRIAGGKDQ
jgi:hypothetical protein